jgi:hypothetical protein
MNWYRTPDGSKTRLVPGEIYFLKANENFHVPNGSERVFVYRGESYRRKDHKLYGRLRYWLEIEILADNKRRPRTKFLYGMNRFNFHKKATFLRLEPKDLPLYLYLPNRYPGFERVYKGGPNVGIQSPDPACVPEPV